MHTTLRPVLAEAPVERPPGPGRPEIVAGLAAYAVLEAAVVVCLRHAVLSDTMAGLIGFVLSAVMGLGAFAVAALLRIPGGGRGRRGAARPGARARPAARGGGARAGGRA
ncbi:hypothetical protein, partial [Streptomyces platensis]|uniref:hypothetical protein n=1 Tax=Streptomyces platensis TaxID=58346 RepID=UPI00367DC6F5